MAQCTKCGMERHDWICSGSRGDSGFPASNHDVGRKLFWPAVAFLVGILNFAFSPAIFAQSVWLDRRHDKTLMLEFFKPGYKNLKGKKTSPIFTEVGIRLPLTPGDDTYAAAAGSISDLDRSESFGEFAALRVIVNFRHQHPSGLVLGLRGGPVVLFQRWDADVHYMSVIYRARLGYEARRFSIGGSLTGRLESNSLLDQSWHQLGFAANCNLGKLRPGAYFSLPLDYHLIDSVVGLNFGLRLK